MRYTNYRGLAKVKMRLNSANAIRPRNSKSPARKCATQNNIEIPQPEIIALRNGSTKFVQKWRDELLKRGYEVHALVYPPLAPAQENFIQYEMNLMDEQTIKKFFAEHQFESLIHLAWYVGPKCHVHDLNMDWLIATLNLLKAFLNNFSPKNGDAK